MAVPGGLCARDQYHGFLRIGELEDLRRRNAMLVHNKSIHRDQTTE